VSLADLPRGFALAWCGAFGLFVGSFLNVCIHRLPKPGMSVWHPRRSHCPSCGRQLTWSENVPLLSWLLQAGRCRGCRWRIPWRYPLVEALTAGAWLWTAWMTPEGAWGLLLVRLLVVSGLIVATFVDFDCFEIPDEVSIGGMLLAPVASLLVPSLHSDSLVARALGSPDGGVDRVAALAASLAGIAVGAGVLLGIGWVGKRVWGREAMGLGDVKLLAAGGGFVGPGGALFALVAASLVASVAGLVNVGRFLWLSRSRTRARGGTKSFARSLATARIAGRYLPFGPYLALGIGIALLHWNHVERWL
jgi:leader peptidase (prepilin peptidase)/N-methyltransferase